MDFKRLLLLKCFEDKDCGRWNSCNFDNGESGFCESCLGRLTARGCQKARFSTKAGFDACVSVCASGINLLGLKWIEESRIAQVGTSPAPRPNIFTPSKCNDSMQCDNGRNMCNFDDEEFGFCENCAHFISPEACQRTGFITSRGFDNCIEHCNDGQNPNNIQWVDERAFEENDEPFIPDEHSWIFTPGKCTDSYQCDYGKNMCNFDDGDHGFCDNCAHFRSAEDCQSTGFITRAGFDNCVKHCAGGANPHRLQWINERTPIGDYYS